MQRQYRQQLWSDWDLRGGIEGWRFGSLIVGDCNLLVSGRSPWEMGIWNFQLVVPVIIHLRSLMLPLPYNPPTFSFPRYSDYRENVPKTYVYGHRQQLSLFISAYMNIYLEYLPRDKNRTKCSFRLSTLFHVCTFLLKFHRIVFSNTKKEPPVYLNLISFL